MPWKEQSKMDERLRFVARRLEGESMTDLCREFGISRKTGYKIFNRYKEEGLIALEDRSRRPARSGSSWCAAWQVTCAFLPARPSMLSSTATAL